MNFLEKNLEMIKKIDKKWYKEIKEAKQPDWFELIYSEDGMQNFLIKRGGQVVPAYDIKKPKKEIERIKKGKYQEREATIVVGMGLGHVVRVFLEKKEKKHYVLLIEPNLFLMKKAFELYDFSEYLKNNEIILVLSDKKVEISTAMAFFESISVIHRWNTMMERYAMLRPDDYAEIAGFIPQMINQINCNVGTMESAGHKIATNDIANLPYIIRHRGVNELVDFFKGKPCVVVSTGPSLQKNIHILKKYQDRVIIIAVAQALRVLLAYDIMPDFIGTVDYGRINEEHFRGLWDIDVPLVALNRSFASILKKWQGSKIISVSQIFGHKDTVIEKLQKKGSLEQGGSVSHFCLGLGIKMGCDPIIIMGQDLAYEGDKSHIPLVDAGGRIKKKKDGSMEWIIDDPRSHLKKRKGTGGKYGMGGQVLLEGYFGEPVVTNIGLGSFLTSFEGIIRAYKKIKFINSTEGGARIKGADCLFLQDAIEKYCEKKLNKKKIKKILSLEHGWKTSIRRIMPAIEYDLDILNDVGKNARKALKLNRELEEENNEKRRSRKKIEKLLKDNEKYSNSAHEGAKRSNLLGLYIFKESRQITSQELLPKRNKKKDLFDERNALRIRIERNKIILKAALKGVRELKKLFLKAQNILKEYLKTGDESLLISKLPIKASLKDVEKYFKVDNWGHPYVDAKRIINNQNDYDEGTIKQAKEVYIRAKDIREAIISKMDKKERKTELLEYNRMVEDALKEGRENKNFEKALHFLEKAAELMPGESYAKRGLATTFHHLGKIEESIKYYEELVEKEPENKRYKFEYGQVLLRKDVYSGISKIKDVMKGTDEFDIFLFRMAQLYLSKKMYKDAMLAYEEYIKKFPYNVQALMELNICYTNLKKDKDRIATQQKIDKLLNIKREDWSVSYASAIDIGNFNE